MARTATGAITIYDVKDGVHPISLVLSNHNHTFAADTNGTVVGAEQTAFVCEVFAYVGATRCTYDSSAPYANYTYRVTKADSTGWVSDVTINGSSQAEVRMTTIPAGTSNKSGTVTLTVIITNDWGNETTITSVITLTKAIEGSAGQVVTLTPTRQTFRYNSSGVTTDGDITIVITSAGITGDLVASGSFDGGTWNTLTQSTSACTSGAAYAKTIDLVAPGMAITFSKENFGLANNYAIKVAGTNGGSDTINIVRVQDGSQGPAAIVVTILSSDSGFVFKNNAGTTKVLSVQVKDMATGNTLTPTNYVWKKNATTVASGGSASTINVTANDITDGGSEQYSCEVTVA